MGEPVTWGGVVYLVLERNRRRKLHAIQARDGESIAHGRNLGRGAWVTLGVGNGTVVVGEPGVTNGFQLRGKSLSQSWSQARKVKGLGPPVVHGERVYVSGKGRLFALDLGSGRATGTVTGFRADGPPGVGRAGSEGGDQVFGARIEPLVQEGKKPDPKKPPVLQLVLYRAPLSAFDGGKGEAKRSVAGNLPTDTGQRIPLVSALALSREAGSPAVWVLNPFAASEKSLPFKPRVIGPNLRVRNLTLGVLPGVHKGLGWGGDDGGGLSNVRPGGARRVVEKDRLPAGAQMGDVTVCGDVLYLGNWAMEATTRRVLWCLPDLDPVSRAVPIADGRFLIATRDRGIVCYGDPSVTEATPTVAASEVEDAGPPEPLAPPTEDDGVLLNSGRHVRGRTETGPDGGYRIVPNANPDEAFEVRSDEVLWIQRDGEVVHRGEDLYALQVWKDTAGLGFARALDDLFQEYAKKRLVSAARALLPEAQRYGMSTGRAHALEAMLARKKDHSSAEGILERMEPERQAIRKEAYDRFRAGAQWCLRRGFPTAAACLLGEARDVWPEAPSVVEDLAATVPDAFPFREEEDAAERWLVWAKELILSGARFVGKEEKDWERLLDPRERRRDPSVRRKNKIWGDDTLCFRTQGMVCFALERDPAVVGACLRYGEGAIRAIRYFFDEHSKKDEKSDDPLEMRVHGTRELYLREMGAQPVEWSAGYYSSREGVSRFFIPRGSDGKVRDRSLYRVVAHELTHHYVDQKVVVRRGDLDFYRPDQPGYWVVEGIARFVEHQASDSVRAGLKFDDPTVQSVDVTVQTEGIGKIMLPSEHVEMPQTKFSGLETKGMATVQLRHAFRSFGVSPLVLFYEQSGALVFWMLNRRGPEGRKAFYNYLQDYYCGRLKAETWKVLGFRTAEELDRAFVKWLREQRGEY